MPKIRKTAQSTGIALFCMMFGVAGCSAVEDASLAAHDGLEPSSGVALEAIDDSGAHAVQSQGYSNPVERGRYLAVGIGSCFLCHSGYNPDGTLDMSTFMAGNPCLIDTDPEDDTQGCLATPNLTNHDTGLARFSDSEIKKMIQKGIKPNGRALHPFMPYWAFANMTSNDTDAVIAYLRTLPGIDRRNTRSQAPWLAPPAATAPIDMNKVPKPSSSYSSQSAAWRGRYLAANTGACIECHTPERHPYPAYPAGQTPTQEEIDAWANFEAAVLDRSFQGGRFFGPTIISRNLTKDKATGLGKWSFNQIVNTILTGVNPSGKVLCGPMRGFSDMTTSDANDIVHYLRSIPPGSFAIPPSECGSPESAETDQMIGRCWPRNAMH